MKVATRNAEFNSGYENILCYPISSSKAFLLSSVFGLVVSCTFNQCTWIALQANRRRRTVLSEARFGYPWGSARSASRRLWRTVGSERPGGHSPSSPEHSSPAGRRSSSSRSTDPFADAGYHLRWSPSLPGSVGALRIWNRRSRGFRVHVRR